MGRGASAASISMVASGFLAVARRNESFSLLGSGYCPMIASRQQAKSPLGEREERGGTAAVLSVRALRRRFRTVGGGPLPYCIVLQTGWRAA